MISAHTPPGTKVVAIETVVDRHIRITVGETYTVDRIVPGVQLRNGETDFGVALAELDHERPAFCGRGFVRIFVRRQSLRYASLPSCLTSLLNAKPVDLPELAGG